MSSIITPSQLILCHKYLQEVQAVMVNTSKLRVHTETQLQGHNGVNVGRKKTENQPVKAPGHQSSEIIRHHLGDWLVNTSFWICEGGTNLSNRTKSQFLCGITKKKSTLTLIKYRYTHRWVWRWRASRQSPAERTGAQNKSSCFSLGISPARQSNRTDLCVLH